MKNLNREDCIFLLVRDYNIPSEYENDYQHIIKTSYNVSSTQGRVFAGLNIFKTRRNIQQFDKLVDEKIKNEPFIWYAQICNDDLCSLMVSKPNCEGYYVIEDGLGSYLPVNKQSFTGLSYWVYKLLLKPLYPRLFCVKNYTIYTDSPKFKGCIATNEDCFPLHQKYLEVIGNPFVKVDLKENIDVILSIDPFYMWIDDETTDKVFYDLSNFMKKKGYVNIYGKFHPYLNAKVLSEQKETYTNILKKYIPGIKFLDSDVVLENVFTSYKCDFITNYSSVCVYAHNLGAKCYTLYPLIKKYKEDFEEVALARKYCEPITD